MQCIEYLAETQLVNARGQLLQVTVDSDMIMRIGGNIPEHFGLDESLVFIALESRIDKLVSADQMSKALFEASERAVSYGMNPNTSLVNDANNAGRFKRALGSLLLPESSLSDNIFGISGYHFDSWSLLVSNFDNTAPENDKRQSILESISVEKPTDYPYELIVSSLTSAYRDKVRRANVSKKIASLNPALSREFKEGIPDFAESQEFIVPSSITIENIPLASFEEDEVEELSEVVEDIRADLNNNCINKEPSYTDSEVYAQGVYTDISELSPGNSGFSIDLIKGYLLSKGLNPKGTDIEAIISVAISKRIIRPQFYQPNPKKAGVVVYER